MSSSALRPRKGTVADRTMRPRSQPEKTTPAIKRDWPRFITFDGELIDTHRSITSLGWRLTPTLAEEGVNHVG